MRRISSEMAALAAPLGEVHAKRERAGRSVSVPATSRRAAEQRSGVGNQLAATAGVSTSALVTRMAKRERESQLLRDMQAGFARLQADPQAWAEHLADTAARDQAAGEL